VTELEGILIERIRREGPMPFAAFMQLALYHPRHGYYSAGPRTGWRGDYITSPELDPAYGELWARSFERVWDACGRPDGFAIVEVGPGEGGFAQAALNAIDPAMRRSVRYILVERVAEVERRQRQRLGEAEGVEWVPSIVDLPSLPAGVVFANEVLDNLPVHVVEGRDGSVLEVCVTVQGDALTEELRPPSNPELSAYLERLAIEPVDGARYEIGLGAESMVRRLAGTLDRGAVFFVDYGDTAERLAERHGGTLVTYGKGAAGTDPLESAGEQDITSHANWTAVARVLRETSMEVLGPDLQADVLRSLGIAELDRELRAAHDRALAEKDGAGAVAALSRRQALRALIDQAGLGGLQVMIGIRGVHAPI
jgi:SAM-dependent MidA family methyltransferase